MLPFLDLLFHWFSIHLRYFIIFLTSLFLLPILVFIAFHPFSLIFIDFHCFYDLNVLILIDFNGMSMVFDYFFDFLEINFILYDFQWFSLIRWLQFFNEFLFSLIFTHPHWFFIDFHWFSLTCVDVHWFSLFLFIFIAFQWF